MNTKIELTDFNATLIRSIKNKKHLADENEVIMLLLREYIMNNQLEQHDIKDYATQATDGGQYEINS